MNNDYGDKEGRYPIKPVTIETVDQAIFDYFDKKVALMVDGEAGTRSKVKIQFATGERWKLGRDTTGLRDPNGTLILPILTIRRTQIDRTKGFGGLGQEVASITISNRIHPKTGNLQNMLVGQQRAGFPTAKKDKVVREYLTIPFPDFATVFYEIVIWSQYQTQMNEILEKIFYSYEIADSFVMPVEYDGKSAKGNSYYFVGFRDGMLASQANVEEFSDQERIIKYQYTIKVPAYFILDPKDEALGYGRKFGEDKTDDGSKVVYKSQNFVNVKLKEECLTLEEFQKLFG